MLDTENRTIFNGDRSRLENLELLDQIHQDSYVTVHGFKVSSKT